MPFVDFASLKASITIEEVAQLLRLDMKQAGNQLRGICPACKTTGGRELVVTPSKSAFYCFAEKKGGDLIALTAHIRGESIKDAALFLADQIGTVKVPVPITSKSTSTSSQESRQPASKSFDRAKYQASLQREHELLKDVPADVITRADLGVSNRGTHKGLISVPLYDKDTGTFLCYVGVPSIQVPKLKLSGETLPANVVRFPKAS